MKQNKILLEKVRIGEAYNKYSGNKQYNNTINKCVSVKQKIIVNCCYKFPIDMRIWRKLERCIFLKGESQGKFRQLLMEVIVK